MNREAFTAMLREELETIVMLNETKGVEYAGETDALDNFKRHARNLDLTPEQIWAVYASKHWDAILSFCRRGHELSTEGIEGRLHDVILYAFLLLGLVKERRQQEEFQKKQGQFSSGLSPSAGVTVTIHDKPTDPGNSPSAMAHEAALRARPA